MIHDHATGSHQDFIATDSLDGLDHEQINRAFIRLKCFAHGCFPTKNEKTKEMSFPNAYGEYFVTGWEYNTAKELGLIEDETIFTVDYSPKTINFFKYVNHWYEYKAAHNKKTHPIEYTIGKILMCSLYGKLAQNIENYWDYKIVPLDTEICRDYMEGEKPFYCANCGEMDHEHGWSKTGIAFGDLTLHCRESLWRAQFKYGAQWRGQLLYKNVATGASITGFARAYLLRAIASVGLGDVIYVDTDSLIMREDADFSGIPISPRLGDWEIEIIDAPRGLFVGKKTYGIDLGNNEPCTCNHMRKICKRHKIASKGSKLTFSDIEEIARGGEIQWKNEAPSFSLLTGKLPVADVIDNPEMFLVRSIRQTA
jgi:hypothetical protein